MTTRVLKKSLKDENELLTAMIKLLEKSASRKFTGHSEFIRKSWIRFLKDRKKTNTEQQKASNTELKKDFLREIAQLGAYIHVTAATGYTERWKKFLECERDISGRLYCEIDK